MEESVRSRNGAMLPQTQPWTVSIHPNGPPSYRIDNRMAAGYKTYVRNATFLLEVWIMKRHTSLKTTLLVPLMLLVIFSGPASAQQSRRGGLYGDWNVRTEFNGRQMESILSFSRDQEGNRTGQWISFWGISELKDLTYEEGRLSFARVRQGRDGQSSTSTFKGTLADGKLSGTVSSDRGEYTLAGERAPRMPRAAGIWDVKITMNEQESMSTLTIGLDEEGELTARWTSERGEPAITDVQYSRGNLSFTMKSSNPGRQWEAAFEGAIEEDALSGAIKSDRGEIAAQGTRKGAALIGTWNLELVSDRGTRTQRLRVNPDMTGLYGALPIKKLSFQNGAVSFPMVLQFGDQSSEMTFNGKLEDSKLTGELTSSRGSQKVTGTKVVRTFRRRSTG